MMASSEATVVTLKPGVVTSLTALRLLWELEDREFTLEAVGNRLRVQPVERLAPQEIVAIRKFRDELLMLVLLCHTTAEAM